MAITFQEMQNIAAFAEQMAVFNEAIADSKKLKTLLADIDKLTVSKAEKEDLVKATAAVEAKAKENDARSADLDARESAVLVTEKAQADNQKTLDAQKAQNDSDKKQNAKDKKDNQKDAESLAASKAMVDADIKKINDVQLENKDLKAQIIEKDATIKSLEDRINGFLASLKG